MTQRHRASNLKPDHPSDRPPVDGPITPRKKLKGLKYPLLGPARRNSNPPTPPEKK